jgi:hypothetical protein
MVDDIVGRKCLCKCYMSWNQLMVSSIVKRKCSCKCYKMSSLNCYMADDIVEGKCLCKCYMTELSELLHG